jgi:senataxin
MLKTTHYLHTTCTAQNINITAIAGKTTTILAMLNALHVRDYNRYFEALLDVSLGEEGVQCRRVPAGMSQSGDMAAGLTSWSNLVNGLSSKGIKPHLLVVAPSNVAVNNMVERIAEKGFRDSSGSVYYPYILRIGSSKSRESNTGGSGDLKNFDAKSVSLEESVDRILQESIEEDVLALKMNLQNSIKEIMHLQTILLNMKHFFQQHPLNQGWELRVVFETAQPYWVDHTNKCTSPTPPEFVPEQRSAFSSLRDLPEYQSYSHTFVELLERLRVNFLRHARLKAIMQHRAEFGFRQMAILRQALEASFIEEADVVFSTLNSAGIVSDSLRTMCLNTCILMHLYLYLCMLYMTSNCHAVCRSALHFAVLLCSQATLASKDLASQW